MNAVKADDYQGETDFMYYFKNKDEGAWYLWIPQCGLAGLRNHKVTEHEDGTITASPSVLLTYWKNGERQQRHGFLEKGIWREA